MKRALFLSLLLTVQAVSAEESSIYRWVGENGREHFATAPVDPRAKQAILPKLRYEDEAPKKKVHVTCNDRGGVSCARGPDPEDGSVICQDGFSEVITPFRFACTMTKLRVTQIDSEVIVVRNERDIEAKSVAVTAQGLPCEGPQKIPPYSIEEYRIPASVAPLKASEVVLKCHNCQ